MSFQEFTALIGITFRNPQQAAQTLIAQQWPMNARWMALIAAVSLSAVLASVSMLIFPIPDSADGSAQIGMLSLGRMPVVLAGMQLFAVVAAAGLMAGVGRMFGGQGNFADALLLTVWIEVTLLVAQLFQVILSIALPGVAGLLGIIAIALFLWLTVQFTTVLHGFRSPARVGVGIFATAIAVAFVLSFIAAAFGLIPEVSP